MSSTSRCRATSAAQRCARRPDHLRHLGRLQPRLQRAGLEPGHVEQVADEAVQPLGLVLRRLQQLGPRLRVQRRIVAAQAGDGAEDRGQRRAQVVADRGQQRRAQPLGLRQHADLVDILGQPHPLDRHRRLVDQRVEQALVVGAEQRPRLVAVDADHADLAASRCARAGTAICRRAACRRRAPPAGHWPSSTAPPPARPRRSGPPADSRPPPAASPSSRQQHDHAQLQHRGDLVGGGPQQVVGRADRRQLAAEPEQLRRRPGPRRGAAAPAAGPGAAGSR